MTKDRYLRETAFGRFFRLSAIGADRDFDRHMRQAGIMLAQRCLDLFRTGGIGRHQGHVHSVMAGPTPP